MAEIVNLRLARKARARSAKEAQAAANRARFGEAGATRREREDDAARAQRNLDAHRLEGD